MRRLLYALIALNLFALCLHAQSNAGYPGGGVAGYPGPGVNRTGAGAWTKRPALGIDLSWQDFQSAAYIRSHSLGAAIRDHKFARWKDMSLGLTLHYLQGISAHLDLSAAVSGSFLDYPVPGRQPFGKKELLTESVVSLIYKLYSDRSWGSPYFLSGVGASAYKGYSGVFLPLGPGFQINFRNQTFLLVNAQYRIPLTNAVAAHFYYSLGVAGNIGKRPVRSRETTPVVPVVPLVGDRDKDGIPDSLDACPEQPGPAQLRGCPDTDGDGIADKEDQCPTIKGIARYNGCPPPDLAAPVGAAPSENIKHNLEDLAKKIFFGSGNAQLQPESFAALNELAGLLQQDTSIRLLIAGHTDNTGIPAKNQLLSEARAAAVLQYLRDQGGINPGRLTAIGYGAARPIADNNTAEGKRRNRRVEFKVDSP
jgi:OOP family OmpA-OmpF porin